MASLTTIGKTPGSLTTIGKTPGCGACDGFDWIMHTQHCPHNPNFTVYKRSRRKRKKKSRRISSRKSSNRYKNFNISYY